MIDIIAQTIGLVCALVLVASLAHARDERLQFTPTPKRAMSPADPRPKEKPSALTGELGALKRTDGTGRVSDELSLTVTDPRLNGGRHTNIPLLVKGQVEVENLLQDKQPKPSQQQVEIAIKRAAERVAAGADLPSYDNAEAAVAAAKARSASRGSAE